MEEEFFQTVEDEARPEDLAVDTDLLELHVALEEAEVTPEQFKEVFGNDSGNQD